MSKASQPISNMKSNETEEQISKLQIVESNNYCLHYYVHTVQ